MIRKPSHERAGRFFHLFGRNAPEHLARVLVHLFGAYVKAVADHAHRAVGEQGQGGGVVVGRVHGVTGQGVGRSHKGRHGQFVQGHGFAAFGVKPHGAPARQQKQLAFRRQGHDFVGAGQSPFPAAPTEHEQIGVVENTAPGVGQQQTGAERGAGHECPAGGLYCAVSLKRLREAVAGATGARTAVPKPEPRVSWYLRICFSGAQARPASAGTRPRGFRGGCRS